MGFWLGKVRVFSLTEDNWGPGWDFAWVKLGFTLRGGAWGPGLGIGWVKLSF
jgi:hypothetical protein